MLKNLNTKTKLMMMPIAYILIVVISTIIYINFNNVVDSRAKAAAQTDIFVQQVLKGRITVYQFLRAPSDTNAQKVVDSFSVLDKNVLDLKNKLTDTQNIKTSNNILSNSKAYIEYFNQFSSKRIAEFNKGILKESAELKPIIANMVKVGLELEKNLNDINKRALLLRDESISSMNIMLISIAVVSIVLFVVFSLLISNIIVSTLEKFKVGLTSFFAFINREKDNSELLEIDGKDEFAQMAKNINENISKTKQGLIKDNETVDEVLSIVQKANKGYLDLEIKSNANNPQLIQLTEALNSMLKGTKHNIDSVNKILKEYSDYKFTSKMDEGSFEGDIALLIKSVNFITDEISNLLRNSYTIGLTLDVASDELIVNVDSLNRSSNEAAASLEETAAALEEITSTIVNNAQNVDQMSQYAKNLTESAKTGQSLAQNTSNAMEEITDQVHSISEAISVIDQIAFQTNILSLNAAVEAATAGEAGKGFAVVAGEVRNLAARSAEAANEIKAIVENATQKAAQGKDISHQMINGYTELLDNITKSTDKINEISNASKEQEQGITQINDAVTQLDQQTQQNAMTASQTHDIAIETDVIAKEIVKDAESKEFIGKENVKARERTSAVISKPIEPQVAKKAEPKKIEKDTTKKMDDLEQKIITSKNDDSEWESF